MIKYRVTHANKIPTNQDLFKPDEYTFDDINIAKSIALILQNIKDSKVFLDRITEFEGRLYVSQIKIGD